MLLVIWALDWDAHAKNATVAISSRRRLLYDAIAVSMLTGHRIAGEVMGGRHDRYTTEVAGVEASKHT